MPQLADSHFAGEDCGFQGRGIVAQQRRVRLNNDISRGRAELDQVNSNVGRVLKLRK